MARVTLNIAKAYDDGFIENIEKICNRDVVYNLAEKCANIGFGILKENTEHFDEETLFYKLISYMDKRYEEIKDEVNSII